MGAWQALMGPKGMPDSVVKTLLTHMNEILKMPDMLARMASIVTVPVGGEGATLGRFNANDHNRCAKVIKEFNIQAD